MPRFNTPEEVKAWADKAAAEDYQRHLPVHTDPDGKTWQVDLNVYSTVGARSTWQRGFDGTPCETLDAKIEWNLPYQRGAAAARLLNSLKETPCPESQN